MLISLTTLGTSGVVDEGELGVTAFVQPVPASHAPSNCVLGVWDEAELHFHDFQFLQSEISSVFLFLFFILRAMATYAIVPDWNDISHLLLLEPYSICRERGVSGQEQEQHLSL